MSTPTTDSLDPVLLFNWDPPGSRKMAVVGFLGASLILHAFCFYLFQVVYAPAVALLPPPARVSLITPNSEESRSLLRWVDAEDPALASATLRPPDARGRALPKLQHVPSYLAKEPTLKHVPALVPETRTPSFHPPGPVPVLSRAEAQTTGPVSSRVLFSDELGRLGAVALPVAQFAASNNESPQALQFRIAVGPRGDVRYCFPLNSSGDPALDEQARQHLAHARFASPAVGPAGSAELLVWGVASLEWGNDVARPAPSPSPSPAP